MMEKNSGVLPAQASMTLYQDDQLSWLSSPEHHVESQWIQPERHQLEVSNWGPSPQSPHTRSTASIRKCRTDWLLIWEHRICP